MNCPGSRSLPAPSFLSAAVAAFAVACGTTVAPALADLPTGFEDLRVIDVPSPTALAQLPDGRILVSSQGGELWLVDADGSPSKSLALNLTPQTCSNSERGLLGVEVDPEFATTRHVFVFYTFRRNGSCSSPVNRVSRFRMPANTLDPASETLLLDGIPSPAGNHNAGDVVVGKDGMLYVSIGDGGCDFRGDSGCAGQNDAARDRDTLLGKIARITRSGEVPADNPFQGSATARCNQGNGPTGTICRETWAWGLRNPFRVALDPNSPSTRIFVNDVGQNDWEEVDILAKGADYGWNVREGRCLTGSTSQCPPPPAQFTDPIHAYDHSDAFGCGSITAGAFVPDGAWPATFDGAYLFADYSCGRIFSLREVSGGNWQRTSFASELGGGGPIAMKFLADEGSGGPAGQQALFYTTYDAGGELRKIVREGAPAGAPVITFQAPKASFRFSVDQPIAMRVTATDPEDGVLPPESITWTVSVRHGNHEHPYEPASQGTTLTVLGPAPEDLEATGNSWLVVRVRAVDSSGQATEIERQVLPKRVRVTLATTPVGLRTRVNGKAVTGSTSVISWAGYRLNVEAFAQSRSGTNYRFVRWSDGGAAQHTVVTPKKPLTLTATYRAR